MTMHKIKSIERYQYTGKVYNVEVEPTHPINDDQFYINAENGLVVHNCHPRDNIALRYLAEKLDLGYDIFDTIINAREIQAKNMADFLVQQAVNHKLPIYIHGKAYKPNVDFLAGSYSLLVGHYVEKAGFNVRYVDPLTEETNPSSIRGVVLLAHNSKVTYGYTGEQEEHKLYCGVEQGSVIVDPWRMFPKSAVPGIDVVYYGNTRGR